MRARTLLIAVPFAVICWIFFADARAGRQSMALFPPHPVGLEDGERVSTLLGQSLADKLKDRFDVHLLDGKTGNDPDGRRRKARALGATYILTGTVSRIGRTATLDVTLAPTENPVKGRTVFVTAGGGDAPAGCAGAGRTLCRPAWTWARIIPQENAAMAAMRRGRALI